MLYRAFVRTPHRNVFSEEPRLTETDLDQAHPKRTTNLPLIEDSHTHTHTHPTRLPSHHVPVLPTLKPGVPDSPCGSDIHYLDRARQPDPEQCEAALGSSALANTSSELRKTLHHQRLACSSTQCFVSTFLIYSMFSLHLPRLFRII